jgi:hypothetical protein
MLTGYGVEESSVTLVCNVANFSSRTLFIFCLFASRKYNDIVIIKYTHKPIIMKKAMTILFSYSLLI